MPEGIKHLVECKCVMPQFKKMAVPPYHKFAVFSELDENTGGCKQSYAQCPNCGAIHRVVEIGQTNILTKDSFLSLPTIEDIKPSLPEWLTALLERHECDMATWQEVKFTFENKKWGQPVVLAKERDGQSVLGKYVIFFSESLHKIETFERSNGEIEF